MGEDNIIISKEMTAEGHSNPEKTNKDELIMRADTVRREDMSRKKEKTLGWKIADVVGFLFVSAILLSMILLIVTS